MEVESVIHRKLSQNLLSTTQVVTKLGINVSDKMGVAIVPRKNYNKMKPKVKYVASRSKTFYFIQERQGAICMGVDADEISQSTPNAGQQQSE